jgi:tetratricopeptide (TPR) repeat protein
VASAEGAAKQGWRRELGGTLLDAAGDLDAGARIASDVLAESPDDVWGRWTTLRAAWAAPSDGTARADAMLALADHTDDAAVSAELLALALHGFSMARTPHEDALLRAGDLEAALPGSAVAARVAREVLTPDDDESERADALERSLVHTPDALSGSLRAAAGRAFSAAGRADDACEALARTVADDPDDLASWEALRVAARDAGRFRHVVEACDRLASAVSGALRATLLEEAAAVLMDELAADVEAEPRLRAALAIDAARPIAFGRLRDLVAERGDEPALLELVQARADRTDDPDALCPLLYEIARLHRSMGQRAEALASLENLMMLEPEHVGGLALQVDLHVQGEAWADAVDALRALAVAKDVPGSQRRIARLGAADFLEKKLSDLPGALEELAAIDALGLGDRALHERMATLFERVGQFDGALEALRKAAASARDGAERAAIERRAARMSQEHRGDVAGATAALRRALVAWPADLDAATSLAAHLEPGPVLELSRSVEGAVRAMLEADPTDPAALRALARAAALRQDAALQASALSTLGALGLATEEERGWLSERAASLRPASARALGDAGVALLLAPGLDAAMLELALLATETVLEIDHPEPAAFGFGRQDQQTGRPLPGVAQAVLDLATFFGAPAGEVWIGGREPRLVTALGHYKGKPAWLLGSAVTAPLAAASRREGGRVALALRLGRGVYASRSPESAATTIFAVAAAAGAPFRGAEGRPGMPDATRAATKAISRRVRKAMPDLVARMGSDGRAVVSFCDALSTSLDRAGCMASGDLESSLRAVLGVAPERSAVRAHESATSLVKLWNSQGAVAMRQDLGLST